MNRQLKSLPYNRLIFMDLEMASGQPTIEKGTELFDLFRYKKRDKETEKLPSIQDTISMYQKEAALSPIYGKIVSSVLGVVSNDTIRLKTFSGEEVDIVRETTKMLSEGNSMIVGFNNKNFDNVYLRKRHAILGLGMFPDNITDVGLKPWEGSSIDIMQLWKSNSYYNDNLDEVCFAMGVKSPKQGDVKGSEVSKVFWSGGIDKIIDYNRADVVATINLFRVLRGEEQIEKVFLVD